VKHEKFVKPVKTALRKANGRKYFPQTDILPRIGPSIAIYLVGKHYTEIRNSQKPVKSVLKLHLAMPPTIREVFYPLIQN
jgi:hypothetical protein